MLKIKASDPLYEKMNYLQTLLCIAYNGSGFGVEYDPFTFLPDGPEKDIAVREIKRVMAEEISGDVLITSN